MNVPTIQMPKHKAVEAYRAYRKAVHDNPDSKEDRAAMMGYKAMASGKALIDVAQALRAAGLDDAGRPKLAIARASWPWCWFEVAGWGENRRVKFARDDRVEWHHRRLYFAFSVSALYDEAQTARLNKNRCKAMVPSIPPQLRPAGRLDAYSILWEAEWQDVPPTDPLLLRHLHGTLFVVLAMWDLTELERAILGAVRQGTA